MIRLSAGSGRRWLTLLGLLLVALNLRPAITSVSPVLGRIGASLGLGSAGQGVLTTLPVLCLGLAAPAAPRLARRLGPERAVFGVLIVLALALLIRPWTGMPGLFAGTAVAGGCIGVMGVLLPGLVKRDFPQQVSVLTGLYTMALCFGASIAAGTTEPLRLAFGGGWQPALMFWLTPAVLAGCMWTLQLRGTRRPARGPRGGSRLHRDGLAWQVTAFMGLQSSLAYTVFGWLPTIVAARGLSPVAAGAALSVSIMVQLISAIAAPAIGARMRDQRVVVSTVMLLTLAGLAGCLYAPLASIWVWVTVLGLGQGGTFSMALTLLALRAPDAETAADLSGMAQGVGYVGAALGPLIVGFIHGVFGHWSAIGGFVALIGIAALAAGLGAGRDRLVHPAEPSS